MLLTAAESLLLQAALLDGDRARAAFAAWKAQAPARLDIGSRRLLQLLYLNLRALGMPEADEGLAESFAKSGARNAALVEGVAPLLRALEARGIACAVLKGLPLALAYYPAPAARPMADGDLLVRPDSARAAADSLLAAGWRPAAPLDAGVLAATHAMPFTSPAGESIDLHWHMQPESRTGGVQDDAWDAMERIDVGGAPALMPGPADMLRHVTVHGMRWSTVPPLRWAADAMMILRKAGGRVDWDRLVDHAAWRRVALPLLEGLAFLRETLDAPVPADVMVRLARIPVSRADRLEFAVKQRPRTSARLVAIHWFQHRRVSNGTIAGDAVRFPRYLRRVWGLRPR